MLLMSVAIMMEGCCKEESEPFIFSYKNVSLYKGAEHILLAAHLGGDTISSYDYRWESSDSTIVSVSDLGIAYAISIGNATITASLNNVTDNCSVSVHEGYDITVPDEIILKVGERKDVAISSKGGDYYIRWDMGDNSYYARIWESSYHVSHCTNYTIPCTPIEEMFWPEYTYDGLKLVGHHEGTTNLRIYVDEIGYDKLIPVTVLP